MTPFKFTKNILEGNSIPVFNHGNHTRNSTYVDDIVERVIRLNDWIAQTGQSWDRDNSDPATGSSPFRIFNIGNNNPVKLSAYIEAIEEALGKKVIKYLMPLQLGDAPDTYAHPSELEKATGHKPATRVKGGVANFAA